MTEILSSFLPLWTVGIDLFSLQMIALYCARKLFPSYYFFTSSCLCLVKRVVHSVSACCLYSLSIQSLMSQYSMQNDKCSDEEKKGRKKNSFPFSEYRHLCSGDTEQNFASKIPWLPCAISPPLCTGGNGNGMILLYTCHILVYATFQHIMIFFLL